MNRYNRWIRNTHKKKQQKTEQKKTQKKRQKRTRGDRSYSERVRAKWLFRPFKLGFLQLICKATLIFKSNLELALSVTLKQRELYESNMLRWSVDI